jgi:hypothetical protein
MRSFFHIYSTPILVVLISIIALLLLIFDGVPFIFSDGYGYYHSAKVLSEEGRFSIETPPEYVEYAGHGVEETTEGFSNRYSPGASIVLAPLLYLLKPLDNGTIYTNYYKAFNGHSISDGLGVLLLAFILSIASFILIHRSQIKLGVKSEISLISTVAGFVGLITLPYIFEFSSFYHIYEIFFVSIMLYWATSKFVTENRTITSTILFSVAYSMAILSKNLNIVLLLPIAFYYFKPQNLRSIRRNDLFTLLLGLIIGAFFSLAMFKYNFDSFGSLIVNTYSNTSGENFIFNLRNYYNFLFSDIRGWFIYSPIAIFSIFILSLYSFRSLKGEKGYYFMVLLAPILLSVILYGAWSAWWAGDSSGQRYMLVALPLISVGIGLGLENIYQVKQVKRRRFLYLVFGGLVMYSALLTFFLRITPTSRLDEYIDMSYSDENIIVDEEEFGVSDILKYQVFLLKNPSQYTESLRGGRSLLLIGLGLQDTIVKVEPKTANEFTIRVLPAANIRDEETELDIRIFYLESEYRVIQTFNISKFSKFDLKCIEEKCYLNNTEIAKFSDANYSIGSMVVNEDLEISISSGSNRINIVDNKLN